MKILIVGSGGREHALAWKLSRSPRVTSLYCAPGNAGIADCAQCVPIDAEDIKGLCDFARREGVELTVVGPEAPLASGIEELFREHGLRIFAPSRQAAQLESSKAFTKAFCQRHGIPTASSQTFEKPEEALAFIRAQPLPLVIKADGLAAGKGVVICKSLKEAEDAVEEMMVQRRFGGAGYRVVVEEFLQGEEASFIALCDGQHLLPLASSQDHKALEEHDRGPNTGGMGAISPAAIVSSKVEQAVMEQIMQPTMKGMMQEGMPFRGVLYAGLMIRDETPYLLEFNVRFGDPETQPLLMRLQSDLVDLLESCCEGRLSEYRLAWDARPAACVVMAAAGYPGPYEKGRVIEGLEDARKLEDVAVFHAGTKRQGDAVITAGGRVLGVTALGDQMQHAIARAYEAVACIRWPGAHYRRDIGAKALRAETREA